MTYSNYLPPLAFAGEAICFLELFSTNYNDNIGDLELPSTIVDKYFGRQELSPTHVDENEMILVAKITNVDE